MQLNARPIAAALKKKVNGNASISNGSIARAPWSLPHLHRPPGHQRSTPTMFASLRRDKPRGDIQRSSGNRHIDGSFEFRRSLVGLSYSGRAGGSARICVGDSLVFFLPEEDLEALAFHSVPIPRVDMGDDD